MAATINRFIGVTASGKPFSFTSYNAANGAIGTFEEVKIIGPATTNDDKILTLPENVIITDIIAGCATGTLRIESNGIDTTVAVDLATHQPTNVGRPKLNIPLGAAKRYRIKVEATLPA